MQDPERTGTNRPERHLLLAERLRQAERRAAAFRVASAIGHLIGTPLNVIAGRAALIRAPSDGSGDAIEHARRIEDQVERLAREVQGLIDYLTPLEPVPEGMSAAGAVDDAVTLCRPLVSAHGIHLSVPNANEIPDGHVDGMATLLVLTTLISLATRLSARGDTLELQVRETAARAIRFEIVAPGMVYPQGRIDRLEPPQQLVGADCEALQALSICFGVAQRHGGALELAKNATGATIVSLTCPRVE